MATKLGGQTGGLFAQARNFFLEVRPACWKVYGNALGAARDYKIWSPNTFIVGREVRGQQFAAEDNDPVGTANAYADLVIATAVRIGNAIDAWEFYNEPVINVSVNGQFDLAASIDAAKKLNLAQVTFSNRLHAYGLKVVAYNLARGNPDLRLVPYLADGAAASEYIGLHAYGDPLFSTDPSNQGLRYMQILDALPPRAQKPVIFTEYGTDFNGGGFRLEANHMSIDDYLTSLKFIDARWTADSRVAGACGFVFGADSGRWQTFEMADDDILPQLSNMMKGSVPVTSASIPPTLPPETVPTAAEIRDAGWNSIGHGIDATHGVDFNADAALYKAAAALDPDAYPTGNEFPFHGGAWVAQGYSSFIVAVKVGDWANTKPYRWSTGEPWVPQQPPQPPTNVPPRMVMVPSQPYNGDMNNLVNTGFMIAPYQPKPGEVFYGLVQVTNFQFGVGTTVVVRVRDSVQPLGGVPVTQAFDIDRIKTPTILTDGEGVRKVTMAAGDDFTPGQGLPPDRIYVSLGDGIDGQKFATPVSDVLVCGQVGGHTSWDMTFFKMVG